jgi:hypothetical protein
MHHLNLSVVGVPHVRELPGGGGSTFGGVITHGGISYVIEAYGKAHYTGAWNEYEGIEIRWLSVNGKQQKPESLPVEVKLLVLGALEQAEFMAGRRALACR